MCSKTLSVTGVVSSVQRVVADDQLVWHTIVLLEKALSKSPSNFQFKLLLIQLYSTLGQRLVSFSLAQVFVPCLMGFLFSAGYSTFDAGIACS